jgi:hypothetical protein
MNPNDPRTLIHPRSDFAGVLLRMNYANRAWAGTAPSVEQDYTPRPQFRQRSSASMTFVDLKKYFNHTLSFGVTGSFFPDQKNV